MKRLTTTLVMIAALLCSFLVILNMGTFKKQFTQSIPDLSLCPIELPAQYQINGKPQYKNAEASKLIQMRPPRDKMQALDLQCQQLISNTFYAIYAYDGNFSQPIANYDFNACTNAQIGLCPVYPQTTFCPCVSEDSVQPCNTYECSSSYTGTPGGCQNFQAKLIGNCYCFSQVDAIFRQGWGLDIRQAYNALSNNQQCKSFYIAYMSQSGLTYVATLLVVIINKILEWFLYYLVSYIRQRLYDYSSFLLFLYDIFIMLYIEQR